MCKHGSDTIVRVKIAAHLSSTGQEKWKDCGIDSCIAPIVKALQESGIDMLGSCCGHGKGDGTILLADGRELIIRRSDARQGATLDAAARRVLKIVRGEKGKK